jgi:hypothetical protein
MVQTAAKQPSGDRWQTNVIQCRGGLNTSEDTLSYLPGEATELINYEPGIFGGYRRISGYTLFDTNAVPGTGSVLGIAVWNGPSAGIVACRQSDVYFGSGTGWNTRLTGPINPPSSAPTLSDTIAGVIPATTYFAKVTYVTPGGETTASPEASLSIGSSFVLIVQSPPQSPTNGATGYNVYVSTTTGTETKQNATPIALGTNWQEPTSGLIAGSALPSTNTGSLPRTSAGKYRFGKYYFGGSKVIAICDGVNPAGRWNGNTYSLINGVGAPTNPKFATFFAGCLVLAGYTSGGGISAFSISSPLGDSDFNGTDGAIEIQTSDVITGLRSYNDVLYIFCQRTIMSLTGTNVSNFVLDYVATGIGLTCPDSLQEVNGDLVYLAEDGIRTLSGTMKLNSMELGDISKPILTIANQIDNQIGNDPDQVSTVVIREKNQYRLFYNTPGQANADALGILGAIRPGKQTMTQFGSYISVWEWATLLGIRPFCCDSDLNGTSEVVAHGMDDGFIYQQELGTSFNGSNIISSYTTAPLTFDDPELRKLLQKITVFLHLEGAASVTGNIVYDFADPTVAQPTEFSFSGATGVAVYGISIFGTGTFGGQVQPKISQNVQGSGKIIQLTFSTTDMNPSHTIQGITIQYRLLGRR